MPERPLKALSLGVFGVFAVTLAVIHNAPAQDPTPIPLPVPGQPAPAAQPPQPDAGDGPEVLAKGPVHEAFAATAEPPAASPVVPKQPPEPIEELPPDQKPAGDNVQWIPGYWSWDEEGTRFIWVSGFWRQPPPGRVWVPGSWREARGGWQYVPGFWQEVAPAAPQQPQAPPVQPQIEYLPQPPQSLEVGPTVAAPGETSVYVPGSWVWRNRYVWRPGVWVEYRPSWVWVPARYHWTPAGYVFADGYWDYPLATRGVLFAPVVFAPAVYARPAFVFTPTYVVSEPCLSGALFVRRGYGGYYFGDYFEARYATGGYSPWCGTVGRGGFSIGFSVGRTWGYDPLWSYYSVAYRSTPRWQGGVSELYAGRFRGDIPRPPVTLVQQNVVINKITNVNVNNVTNNVTVVNHAVTVNNRDVTNVAMVAPLKVAPDLQRTKFEPVAAAQRREEATAAKQLRDVGVQRTKLETAEAARPHPPAAAPGAPPAAPRSIKLDVPHAVVARAQTPAADKAPPPNPLRATGAKVDPPHLDPKGPAAGGVAHPAGTPTPGAMPKGPTTPGVPAVPPRVEPHPAGTPAPTPLPKVEPKGPAAPATNPGTMHPTPTPLPKGPATPGAPAVPPKVEPHTPTNPVAPPRVEPKAPVTPVPTPPSPAVPRVEPKGPAAPLPGPTSPPAPPTAPKVEPKGPVTPAPVHTPPGGPAPTTSPGMPGHPTTGPATGPATHPPTGPTRPGTPAPKGPTGPAHPPKDADRRP